MDNDYTGRRGFSWRLRNWWRHYRHLTSPAKDCWARRLVLVPRGADDGSEDYYEWRHGCRA